MTFKTSQNLENLLARYIANMNAVEKASVSQAKDPDSPIHAKIYTDKKEIPVNAEPDQVIKDALSYMSLFPKLFETEGLGENEWDDFMNTYFLGLDSKVKDQVMLQVLQRYSTKEQLEALSENAYIATLSQISNLVGLLKKESLNDDDLKTLTAYFTYKGKDGKVFQNPYAIAAIEDNQNNPQVVKGLIELQLTLYTLAQADISDGERKKAEREIMSYDNSDTYGLRNYPKAAIAYNTKKALEAQTTK